MAKDGETPKPVDKGKGKEVDGEASKTKEVEKDKDGKPLVNGKKEEPVVGGVFILSGLIGSLLTLHS
jgi:26S proteasome regulatory subunit N1